MIKFGKNDKQKNISKKIDNEIENAVDALSGLEPETEEYARVVKNAKSLHDIKDEGSRLNINTVVSVGGSIVVCVLALGFEKFGNGIFPWKISGFMPKK